MSLSPRNYRVVDGNENPSAILSACRRYRYFLTRQVPALNWLAENRKLCVVMLNPSTADENTDDATIRAVLQFAAIWGYSAICVVNLYAFRATDPSDLFKERERVGFHNDQVIYDTALMCGDVLLACGADAEHSRFLDVLKILKAVPGARLTCLGTTKRGFPRHPLYVKRSTPRMTFDVRIEGNGWEALLKPLEANRDS